MRSLRISCENSQNRIRSAVSRGFLASPGKRRRNSHFISEAGAEKQGFFQFPCVFVWFSWGFRVCTLHNLLYSPGAGRSAGICRFLPTRTVQNCSGSAMLQDGGAERGGAVAGCASVCSDVV
jgi:hypothetical protein